MQEYDHYVQCEGRCKRWYHYLCAFFPDPEQLPSEYDMQKKAFVCKACQADPGGYEHIGPLVELQVIESRGLLHVCGMPCVTWPASCLWHVVSLTITIWR